jgi:hypothetical protein
MVARRRGICDKVRLLAVPMHSSVPCDGCGETRHAGVSIRRSLTGVRNAGDVVPGIPKLCLCPCCSGTLDK